MHNKSYVQSISQASSPTRWLQVPLLVDAELSTRLVEEVLRERLEQVCTRNA
jgi:hypothetical protein